MDLLISAAISSNTLERLVNHFKIAPTSCVFIVYLIVVLLLNIIKHAMICSERKRHSKNEKCDDLIKNRCTNSMWMKYFKENEDCCVDCPGRTSNITSAKLEQLVTSGPFWKRILVMLANYGNNSLPYLSFLYTLFIAILES